MYSQCSQPLLLLSGELIPYLQSTVSVYILQKHTGIAAVLLGICFHETAPWHYSCVHKTLVPQYKTTDLQGGGQKISLHTPRMN